MASWRRPAEEDNNDEEKEEHLWFILDEKSPALLSSMMASSASLLMPSSSIMSLSMLFCCGVICPLLLRSDTERRRDESEEEEEELEDAEGAPGKVPSTPGERGTPENDVILELRRRPDSTAFARMRTGEDRTQGGMLVLPDQNVSCPPFRPSAASPFWP